MTIQSILDDIALSTRSTIFLDGLVIDEPAVLRSYKRTSDASASLVSFVNALGAKLDRRQDFRVLFIKPHDMMNFICVPAPDEIPAFAAKIAPTTTGLAEANRLQAASIKAGRGTSSVDIVHDRLVDSLPASQVSQIDAGGMVSVEIDKLPPEGKRWMGSMEGLVRYNGLDISSRNFLISVGNIKRSGIVAHNTGGKHLVYQPHPVGGGESVIFEGDASTPTPTRLGTYADLAAKIRVHPSLAPRPLGVAGLQFSERHLAGLLADNTRLQYFRPTNMLSVPLKPQGVYKSPSDLVKAEAPDAMFLQTKRGFDAEARYLLGLLCAKSPVGKKTRRSWVSLSPEIQGLILMVMSGALPKATEKRREDIWDWHWPGTVVELTAKGGRIRQGGVSIASWGNAKHERRRF